MRLPPRARVSDVLAFFFLRFVVPLELAFVLLLLLPLATGVRGVCWDFLRRFDFTPTSGVVTSLGSLVLPLAGCLLFRVFLDLAPFAASFGLLLF